MFKKLKLKWYFLGYTDSKLINSDFNFNQIKNSFYISNICKETNRCLWKNFQKKLKGVN